MGSSVESAGTGQVAQELLHDLAGILDPVAVGTKAATVLRHRVGIPLVSFALPDDRTHFAMCCGDGVRTDAFYEIRVAPGQGAGGRALQGHRTFTVEDYSTDPRITDHFRSIVDNEGLHGVAAVPVVHDRRGIGILYGAMRDWGRPDDATISALESAATVLAPLLTTATTARDSLRLRVGQERQRIAGALHDDLGQLLFTLTSTARRAVQLSHDCAVDRELGAAVARMERLAELATGKFREALDELGPSTPDDRLPVAAQRDVDDFTARTDIPAFLLMPHEPAQVAPDIERAALACLRQALFNIERHASASLVVVTIDFAPDCLVLVVQDDGHGMPSDVTPRAVPSGPSSWGFAYILRQAEQLGGSMQLRPGEDGGTRMQVRLPIPDQKS